MKANLIPKHYATTMTPPEMTALIRMVETYCREYHTDEIEEGILAALKEASEQHIPDEREDEGGAKVG